MGDAGSARSTRVRVSATGGEALQEHGAFPQTLLVFYGVLYGVLWCSQVVIVVFDLFFKHLRGTKGD